MPSARRSPPPLTATRQRAYSLHPMGGRAARWLISGAPCLPHREPWRPRSSSMTATTDAAVAPPKSKAPPARACASLRRHSATRCVAKICGEGSAIENARALSRRHRQREPAAHAGGTDRAMPQHHHQQCWPQQSAPDPARVDRLAKPAKQRRATVFARAQRAAKSSRAWQPAEVRASV